MEEYVVLVNSINEPIGKARKDEVHHDQTPLHRGFSLFVFRKNGDVLLQQRSRKKKTFPLVWSNSCCGHPQPGESAVDAAKRRAKEELGLDLTDIKEIIHDYRYRAEMNGIVENEFCPVLMGYTNQEPVINPNEVETIKWLPWQEWVEEITRNPQEYSSWSVEETQLLSINDAFIRIYTQRAS